MATVQLESVTTKPDREQKWYNTALWSGAITALYWLDTLWLNNNSPVVLAPATAIVIGLLLKQRFTPSVGHWLALAFMMALGLQAGGWSTEQSIYQSLGSFAQIALSYRLLAPLPLPTKRLATANSILIVFLVCLIASAANAATNLLIHELINTATVDSPLSYWFNRTVFYLLNMMLFLPLILVWSAEGWPWQRDRQAPALPTASPGVTPVWMPILSVILLLAVGQEVGDYGVMIVPIPAILWCALRYRLGTSIAIHTGICL